MARTPQGERRGEGHRVRRDRLRAALPEALVRGGRSGPDTRDREAVGRALLETLASFGVDAEIVGTVIGPHVSRYELRLAPGTKSRSRSSRTTSRTRSPRRTSASSRRSPASRRSASRSEPAPAAGSPRRHPEVAAVLADRRVAGQGHRDTHGVDRPREDATRARGGNLGSGKSGCINAILSRCCFTRRRTRSACSSTKQVELNHYEQVPHLLTRS